MPETDTLTFFEVIFDTGLSWKPNLENIETKAIQRFAVIKKKKLVKCPGESMVPKELKDEFKTCASFTTMLLYPQRVKGQEFKTCASRYKAF